MNDEDDTDAGTPAIDLEAMDEVRPGAWMAPGNQMVVNDRLIAGRSFAHRITDHELVAGWLEVDPDFAPLGAFASRYTTADGTVIDVVEPGGDERVPATTAGPVLLGPEGWLDGGWANAYVVLTAEGAELTMRWEDRADIAIDPAPVIALFESLGGGSPVPLLDMLLRLLVEAPELFTEQTAPLRDLLGAAGLVRTEGFVALEGDVPVKPSGNAALPGLRLESSLAAQRLLQSVLASREAEITTDEVVLAALADFDAVAAMAEQVVGATLVEPSELEAWLEALDIPGVGASLAGATFLRSRLAEWRGDVGAEESALMASIHMVEQPAALVDAAWFASDRGDARNALALLRAAGVPPDDPEAELLRGFTMVGPLMVGRNDPCWCGSGRKHKHCCLRLNGHGLPTRTRWLQAKAITFLQRPPQRAAMLEVAVAYAGVASAEEAPDRVIAAACDSTVAELSLFDAGLIERFVAQRGHLLPDDERELAESWIGARHALYDVELGDEPVLRRRDTGDALPVDKASAAKLPATGTILASARPGPVVLPGSVLIVAAALVDEVAALVEAQDVIALAARIGSEFGWTAAPDLSFASAPAGASHSVPR